MTYSELLHSVTFDEIAPFVEKKAGRAVCLALYKTHYDMLRLLTPRRKENDNETAAVTNAKLYHEWEEPKLDAYPLEGDLWEVSLAKELVTACLPALQSDKEMSANDLCRLFLSNHFAHYSYQTYAGSAADRGRWMMELIEKYDAFCGSNGGIRPNVMMLVTVSPEHPFSDSDRQLTDMIARMCSGRTTLLLKHDDRLGEELQLNVAFYGELKNRRRHRPLPCSGRGAQYFCPKKTRI